MSQFTAEHKQKLSAAQRRYRQTEDDLWVRVYKIILPDGSTSFTPNLKKYCHEHGLSYECMKKISYGKYMYHKGHTCQIITAKPRKIVIEPTQDDAILWQTLHHIVFNQNRSRQFI